MKVRVILFSVLCLTAVHSQEIKSGRKAILYSAFFPGLGELYLADWKMNQWASGRYFFGTELALLSSHIIFTMQSGWMKNDSRALAAGSASVDLRSPKPVKFYVSVGKYRDIYAYNEAQRRNSGRVLLYEETSENYWQWESDAKRKRYDRMRIDSRLKARYAEYMIYGMVANRLMSIVNVSRIFRLQKKNLGLHIDFIPEPGGSSLVSLTLNKTF